MSDLIDYATFRALKACRSIGASNAQIMTDLHTIRKDAGRVQESLQEASERLEESLEYFDDARDRLRKVNEQHTTVMEIVNHIMNCSPAFQ